MPVTDYVLSDQDGASFRSEINTIISILVANNSNATAPTTTFAYMFWADTTANILKMRNAANSAWINILDLGDGGVHEVKGQWEVLAKTAAYTVVTGDERNLIDADANSAAFTITLPTVATAGNGFMIAIKKTDSSANAVAIDGNGSETIDGAITTTLDSQYQSIILVCDGAEWHVVKTDTLSAASQAEQEAGTEAGKYVAPATQQYHPSAAKGWVKFDSAGVVAVSLNVASITDNGAGDWTVNWDTDFSSVDHADFAMPLAGNARQISISAQAAGTSRMITIDTNNNPTDNTANFVLGFGDQ